LNHVGGDDDGAAGFDLAGEDLFGDLVFDDFLDDAAHGAGAETGVVAEFDHLFGGSGVDLDFDFLVGEGFVDASYDKVEDLEEFGLAEGDEGDDFVETV